ncbi:MULTISPECIES: NYN domain-containing protein [Cyanophyceae]|uniref:NYN domain-containing protein n=1 Tax=Cyanophyceae TaxID=3028117 RepID=UPI00232D0594|nr:MULTISPECIES: NYN domain-containing protein [Cyanophyceae]MDB9356935.1 NYN domain-containing protein [Nodularia spumigena CS-587/03]MDB9341707.1 NYN domain-containing protein [Nodularia spumigena CS-589/07]MDB9400043.1 NYN domain-containing protein [Microcystis aeruginosa CS-567/02-A1]MDB9499331.1 NYN domain-containing protein [Nodularia spumigena CS-336/02]MDB9530916.1 NYN domain-containing protein [Nodularia spumigena CS-1038]
MSNEKDLKLTRIGIFYDGNYFLKVSNYYNYNHIRKSRISLSGLHEFVRTQVAQEEATDVRLCQIVDAHYFRGRLSAGEATDKQLYYDRVFDDILMSEGVITHYLPVKSRAGKREEKGIDVWLALEAFELAFYKRFSVLVLVACDGDYVPLIRKLNTLGTRVMVLSWDFEYMNEFGENMITRTSQDLLEEVTYPVAMHEIIDNRVRRNEPLINNLFIAQKASEAVFKPKSKNTSSQKSTILNFKQGFGFIKLAPNNLFFHYTDLINADFNDLTEGTSVQFSIGKNEKGEDVAKNVQLLAEPES